MSPCGLVGDIGGTNARFALVRFDDDVPRLHEVRALPAARYASLQDAVRDYLQETGSRPARAAFAIASPLEGEEVRMTNRGWSFGREALRQSLGLGRLLLLNDFGAVARAVPVLDAADLAHVHGPAAPPVRAPTTVLGPGTGLGMALLVESGGWQVIETEGGHAAFAALDDEERTIARRIEAVHGRVSNERLLSGDGLARIDAALRGAGDDALREPAEIVARALDGSDADARRALDRFCAILGSVCGDAVLMHGARGLVIGGGIVPRFLPFLRAGPFLPRFLAKGRFSSYVERASVHVITHPQPGLLGAAVALRSMEPSP